MGQTQAAQQEGWQLHGLSGLRNSLRMSSRSSLQESTICSEHETPEVDNSRHRKMFLNRLGIHENMKESTSCSTPTSPTKRADSRMRLDSKYSNATHCSERLSDSTNEGDDATSLSSFDEKEDSDDEKVLFQLQKDNFRTSLLRKLSYESVWVPVARRPPKHQTVIIFDWDDTLLCTHYLAKRPLSQLDRAHLKKIERIVQHLLELAPRLGQTFIITNAMHGWVEYSAAKYVPNLLPVLGQTRIISARSRYEQQYPSQVGMWKVEAFRDVQQAMDTEVITNLVSLGDSLWEADAVKVMGKDFEEAFVKIIKFKEKPTPLELLKELELVADKLETIVEFARDTKIVLERK